MLAVPGVVLGAVLEVADPAVDGEQVKCRRPDKVDRLLVGAEERADLGDAIELAAARRRGEASWRCRSSHGGSLRRRRSAGERSAARSCRYRQARTPAGRRREATFQSFAATPVNSRRLLRRPWCPAGQQNPRAGPGRTHPRPTRPGPPPPP